MSLYDAVGYAGALALLGAYTAFANDRLAIPKYHAINLAGSIALATSAFHDQAYPPAWLNVIWATVAAVTLLRRRRKPEA